MYGFTHPQTTPHPRHKAGFLEHHTPLTHTRLYPGTAAATLLGGWQGVGVPSHPHRVPDALLVLEGLVPAPRNKHGACVCPLWEEGHPK